MLIIRKNQTNNLIATVSMNKTLANPYYLFSFQHIASKDRISFFPEVITSNIRYDKFRFVEHQTTNLNVVPPQVFFEYLGQYYYSIYECITSASTDTSLAYNKLESGRAWVIVGDDNVDECFFEPYISNDEDFAQVIYVSEEEEACIYPTPSITPSNTPTPSITPTNTSTPSITQTNTPTPSITPTMTQTSTPTLTPTPSTTPPSYTGLTFIASFGSTHSEACGNVLTGTTFNIYANDLGNCGGCLPTYNCWPCLNTTQSLYYDQALTQPVADGYYKNVFGPTNAATWKTIGGHLQGGGFQGC